MTHEHKIIVDHDRIERLAGRKLSYAEAEYVFELALKNNLYFLDGDMAEYGSISNTPMEIKYAR